MLMSLSTQFSDSYVFNQGRKFAVSVYKRSVENQALTR